MLCGYCTNEATLRIPAIPDDVCQTHAVNFWQGLLTYAKANPPEAVVRRKPSPKRLRPNLPMSRSAMPIV
jgi:hypothetical protein